MAAWVARTSAPDARIVAVFPDGPQRYFDTVYSDEFCRRHDLLDGVPAPHPDRIGRQAEREVTQWTRCTAVTDPSGSEDVRRP